MRRQAVGKGRERNEGRKCSWEREREGLGRREETSRKWKGKEGREKGREGRRRGKEKGKEARAVSSFYTDPDYGPGLLCSAVGRVISTAGCLSVRLSVCSMSAVVLQWVEDTAIHPVMMSLT